MGYNQFGETPEMAARRRRETWHELGIASLFGGLLLLILSL